jgi:hypothetical protein
VQITTGYALISARRTGGAYGLDTMLTADTPGSVHMYTYSSSTGWTLAQSFSEALSADFGESVALWSDGSLFAVGGPSAGNFLYYKKILFKKKIFLYMYFYIKNIKIQPNKLKEVFTFIGPHQPVVGHFRHHFILMHLLWVTA